MLTRAIVSEIPINSTHPLNIFKIRSSVHAWKNNPLEITTIDSLPDETSGKAVLQGTNQFPDKRPRNLPTIFGLFSYLST